jgi:methionyl-tRNA formyltransferase
MGVSVLFGYILRAPFLSLFPRGIVNLHPAFLPYNRGAYPNVWSIVERTPAGATLHYVDAGVDTGDIVSQATVPVSQTDTGATLYSRLEQAAFALFRDTWPRLRAGDAPRVPQPPGGTSHRVADVARIDAIDLDHSYRARDLIDILRARTFPPYSGAYFEVDGRRVYMRLELAEGGEDR